MASLPLEPNALRHEGYVKALCERVANMPPGEYSAFLISQGCQPKPEVQYNGRQPEAAVGVYPVQ